MQPSSKEERNCLRRVAAMVDSLRSAALAAIAEQCKVRAALALTQLPLALLALIILAALARMADPGIPIPAAPEVSNQKVGSVLVHHSDASSASSSNIRDTRINFQLWLSNTFQGSGIAPTGDPGGFHIDGDLLANTPTDNVSDWLAKGTGTGVGVLTAAGVPVDPTRTFHFVDPFNDQNDDIFTGGSKVNGNPNTSWFWMPSKPAPKDDLNNGLLHIMTDANNHMWFVVGGDRLSNNGDSHIDFEFDQNTMTKNANRTFTSEGPDGGRTVGDLLVNIDLEMGGMAPSFKVSRWQQISPGVFDYVSLTTVAGTAFLAANNTGTTPVSFGAFGSDSYSQNQFGEAAIDITALIANLSPCIGIKTAFIKTAASSSPDAELKDMIGPIQLNVGTAPIADAGPDQTKCLDPSGTTVFTLKGVVAAGSATPLWSLVSTSGAITPADVTIVSPNNPTTDVLITNSKTGKVTLRLTSSVSCGTATDQIVLTVNPIPTADAGNDQTLCLDPDGTTNFTRVGVAVTDGKPSWSIVAVSGTITVPDVRIGNPDSAVTNVDILNGKTGAVTLALVSTSGVGCGTATDEVELTVLSAADLSVTKTASPSSVVTGSTITYTIVITNNGPCDAQNVMLVDSLPRPINTTRLLSLDPPPNWTCTPLSARNPGLVRCTTPALAANKSATFTLTTLVDCSPADGMISNQTTVSSSTFDPDPRNNQATAKVMVIPKMSPPVLPLNFGIVPTVPSQNGPLSFTIENTGCDTLSLSLMVKRDDLANGRIANSDDSALFPIRFPNGDMVLAPVSILAGQQQSFNVFFAPVIPNRACPPRASGLSANQVLPEMISSTLTIMQNGGSPLSVKLMGQIKRMVKLIHPDDSKLDPLVTLSRCGDEFAVECSVYATDYLDVRSASYQFLDRNGRPVEPTFVVDDDLVAVLRQPGVLTTGQSFTIRQRFSGASDHSEVAGVRVTIFNNQPNSDTATSVLATPACSTARCSPSLTGQAATLMPPALRLAPRQETPRTGNERATEPESKRANVRRKP